MRLAAAVAALSLAAALAACTDPAPPPPAPPVQAARIDAAPIDAAPESAAPSDLSLGDVETKESAIAPPEIESPAPVAAAPAPAPAAEPPAEPTAALSPVAAAPATETPTATEPEDGAAAVAEPKGPAVAAPSAALPETAPATVPPTVPPADTTAADPAAPSASAAPAAADAGARSFLPKDRKKDVPLEMTWEQLASFEYVPPPPAYPDPDTGVVPDVSAEVEKAKKQIPAEIWELEGVLVSVEGYMIPLAYQEDGVSSFLVSRHAMGCCFGVMPRAHELIECQLPDGRTTAYVSYLPVVVTGHLHVGPKEGPQTVLSGIYRIDDPKVVVKRPEED